MINILPLANIIMGISFEFYGGLLLFCVIILPVEVFVFKLRENIPFAKILLSIFLANIVSWIVGFIISATTLDFLPLFSYSHYNRKQWVVSLFSIFIVSFFLSWFIEYLFLKFFSKRFSFSHLFKTTGYANMFSYLSIYVIVFGWIIIEGLFF